MRSARAAHLPRLLFTRGARAGSIGTCDLGRKAAGAIAREARDSMAIVMKLDKLRQRLGINSTFVTGSIDMMRCVGWKVRSGANSNGKLNYRVSKISLVPIRMQTSISPYQSGLAHPL